MEWPSTSLREGTFPQALGGTRCRSNERNPDGSASSLVLDYVVKNCEQDGETAEKDAGWKECGGGTHRIRTQTWTWTLSLTKLQVPLDLNIQLLPVSLSALPCPVIARILASWFSQDLHPQYLITLNS